MVPSGVETAGATILSRTRPNATGIGRRVAAVP